MTLEEFQQAMQDRIRNDHMVCRIRRNLDEKYFVRWTGRDSILCDKEGLRITGLWQAEIIMRNLERYALPQSTYTIEEVRQ